MKRVKYGVSGHFPKNAWRQWPEILYADVSWLPSELIRLWSNFGSILTKWNGSNLGFVISSWRTHWGNGLTFCMLMYPDHLQNGLDSDHSLLIFRVLTLFWLSETGFQVFCGALWIFFIIVPPWLKPVIFGFLGIIWFVPYSFFACSSIPQIFTHTSAYFPYL